MAKKRIRYSKRYRHPVAVRQKPSLVMISAVLAIVFIAYVGLMGLVTNIASLGNSNAGVQASNELSSYSPGFNFNIDPTNLGLAILLLVALIAVAGIIITIVYRRPRRLSPIAHMKRRR